MPTVQDRPGGMKHLTQKQRIKAVSQDLPVLHEVKVEALDLQQKKLQVMVAALKLPLEIHEHLPGEEAVHQKVIPVDADK